jgi:hypothetical protein
MMDAWSTNMKRRMEGRKREGINGRTDERTEHMKGWINGTKGEKAKTEVGWMGG